MQLLASLARMSNPSIVVRASLRAFDFLSSEAVRLRRPFIQTLDGAARALEQLSPADREALIIGEPRTPAERRQLGLKPATKRNRKKGGAL